jgi:hypothetical protein
MSSASSATHELSLTINHFRELKVFGGAAQVLGGTTDEGGEVGVKNYRQDLYLHVNRLATTTSQT